MVVLLLELLVVVVEVLVELELVEELLVVVVELLLVVLAVDEVEDVEL